MSPVPAPEPVTPGGGSGTTVTTAEIEGTVDGWDTPAADVVTISALAESDLPAWQAEATVEDGDLVRPTVKNGHQYHYGDGETGVTEPSFPVDGTYVLDGSAYLYDDGLDATFEPAVISGLADPTGPRELTVVNSGPDLLLFTGDNVPAPSILAAEEAVTYVFDGEAWLRTAIAGRGRAGDSFTVNRTTNIATPTGTGNVDLSPMFEGAEPSPGSVASGTGLGSFEWDNDELGVRVLDDCEVGVTMYVLVAALDSAVDAVANLGFGGLNPKYGLGNPQANLSLSSALTGVFVTAIVPTQIVRAGALITASIFIANADDTNMLTDASWYVQRVSV